MNEWYEMFVGHPNFQEWADGVVKRLRQELNDELNLLAKVNDHEAPTERDRRDVLGAFLAELGTRVLAPEERSGGW